MISFGIVDYSSDFYDKIALFGRSTSVFFLFIGVVKKITHKVAFEVSLTYECKSFPPSISFIAQDF